MANEPWLPGFGVSPNISAIIFLGVDHQPRGTIGRPGFQVIFVVLEFGEFESEQLVKRHGALHVAGRHLHGINFHV
jgi:hypothetical protein